jgi:hypothetical protein
MFKVFCFLMVNKMRTIDMNRNTTLPRQWKVIGKSYVNEPLYVPFESIKISPMFSPDGEEYIIINI